MPLIDKTKSPLTPEPTELILSRIQVYIRNQVRQGRKFTIKDLSDELNMSEYNLNKTLIKGTRQTIKSFIADCRREFYEHNSFAQEHLDENRGPKVGVCLTARKTGVDLLQMSAKRLRLH